MSVIEKLTDFINFPSGLITEGITDGYTTRGKLAISGSKKLTSKQGQEGSLNFNIAQNYFRAETNITISSAELPVNPSTEPMIAIGLSANADSKISYGLGIYNDGSIRKIENSASTPITTLFRTETSMLRIGEVQLKVACKNGKMYISFNGSGVYYAIGREMTLPALDGYNLRLQMSGSQASYDLNEYGTGFYVDAFTFRNDWSCYSDINKQREIYLPLLFSGGEDYAWAVIPKNHSLIGRKQRIYMLSHAHYHTGYQRNVDYFGGGFAELLNDGYAGIYLDGRPVDHWGNPATIQQAENARKFLFDNFNFEAKAFLYGSSMGCSFVANYAYNHPSTTGAIAMDVPAISFEYMNTTGYHLTDSTGGYTPAYSSLAEMRANDPLRNASSFDISIPMRIEAGLTDVITPHAQISTPFVNAVRASGNNNVMYLIENKGHAGSITKDEKLSLFESVPRELVSATNIVISPKSVIMLPEQQQEFTATAYDTKGNMVNIALTYLTSDPTIATIDQNGLLTALKAGSVTVIVESEGIYAEADVVIKDSFNENSAYLNANKIAILTLKNPNPSLVLWNDFGYIDDLGNPVSDPQVSLDGINYFNKVNVVLQGNESKQVHVKFTDITATRSLKLNKKLRG